MDGFEEPYWNLIQTLAWVFLGDRAFVRRASDEVTDHGTFWQELILPDGRKELVETSADPPGLVRLSIEAARRGGACYSNIAEAEHAVLTAMREGRLRAWGLKNGRGDLQEISQVQWASLEFFFDRRERPYATPRNHSRSGATHWHGLKFLRTEVLALWLDPFDKVLPDASGSPAAQRSVSESPTPAAVARNEAAEARNGSRRRGADAQGPDPHSSGFPGRPSKSKQLIEQEFQRRMDAGEVCSTLSDEASALLEWLQGKHPSAPPPTIKTIKNNLRGQHREYKLKQCLK